MAEHLKENNPFVRLAQGTLPCTLTVAGGHGDLEHLPDVVRRLHDQLPRGAEEGQGGGGGRRRTGRAAITGGQRQAGNSINSIAEKMRKFS